jgi:hypothetical protein
MQFWEWLRHQQAADELFLHTILWTDEICFPREGAFGVHNSHLWALDHPHDIREHVHQVRFSVSVWTGVVGVIDRPTALRHRDFMQSVLLWLPEDLPQL